MTRLQTQIEQTKAKLAKLRDEENRAKLQVVKSKPKKKRGRKKISETVLIRAVELAEGKTLPDVAHRLDVSLSTLYKYGIKRYILEGKTGRKAA
jgi:transcriptional regulator of acetoin/glycerol metabolism